MPIGQVWIIISVTVFCLFIFYVCTVTDFSAEDKASGIKFFTVVHRRLWHEISHFGEHFSPRSSPGSPKSNESVASISLSSHGVGDARAHGPCVGSACVDIRLSPKTDVLVYLFIYLIEKTKDPKFTNMSHRI